ncbi:hypothetical protein F5Y18DRAFT_35159 [Xylariaceae sp. FL1019]|nr:hypothetical protein F5Y18DRAFT_35159 [Xylariaceae sp. FL1019]
MIGSSSFEMSGPPGSGKSTLARSIAASMNGIVINHDLLKSYFLSRDFSFEESAKLTYGLDWVLAQDMLAQGRTVIIDSVCNYDEVIERGTALAAAQGCEYRYVECQGNDIEILDRRLRSRTSLSSQRTGVNEPPLGSTTTSGSTMSVETSRCADELDGSALFKKWMNPRRPDSGVIAVDATRNPHECLEFVLNALASPGVS